MSHTHGEWLDRIRGCKRKEKSMDQMTLTLNSPITEEQWDMITDVDFDHTDSITFHTKHGKEVEFVKRKTGKWVGVTPMVDTLMCSECGYNIIDKEFKTPYCPNCGAKMEGEQP